MVGFIDGYLTMDSLVVLAFTLVLSNTVKQRGITKPTTAIKSSLYASAIASALIGIIYFFLLWMGNHTSVTSIPDGQNIGTHLLVRASQDGLQCTGCFDSRIYRITSQHYDIDWRRISRFQLLSC